MNKTSTGIKTCCISHKGSTHVRVITSLHTPPGTVCRREGIRVFPSHVVPQRHFAAGGGQEYNEVPPINQVTGRGSEGDRNPFSFS